MSAAPTQIYSQNQLQPALNPEDARCRSVNLVAGTYLRGTVLGEVTDVGVDAVQTVTVTGTPTSGTLTLLVTPIVYGNTASIVVPFNCTVAQAQPLFDAAYGPGNTVITGTTLPGGSLIVTFVGALAGQPVAAITKGANALGGGTTPNFAIAQTTPGVLNVGTFGPYANGGSDGTQFAKGLLVYSCVVDASGNITISSEIPGFSEKSAPMYYAGVFRTEELVGLPTSGNLVVDFPGARVMMGTLASGLLVLAGA